MHTLGSRGRMAKIAPRLTNSVNPVQRAGKPLQQNMLDKHDRLLCKTAGFRAGACKIVENFSTISLKGMHKWANARLPVHSATA